MFLMPPRGSPPRDVGGVPRALPLLLVRIAYSLGERRAVIQELAAIPEPWRAFYAENTGHRIPDGTPGVRRRGRALRSLRARRQALRAGDGDWGVARRTGTTSARSACTSRSGCSVGAAMSAKNAEEGQSRSEYGTACPDGCDLPLYAIIERAARRAEARGERLRLDRLRAQRPARSGRAGGPGQARGLRSATSSRRRRSRGGASGGRGPEDRGPLKLGADSVLASVEVIDPPRPARRGAAARPDGAAARERPRPPPRRIRGRLPVIVRLACPESSRGGAEGQAQAGASLGPRGCRSVTSGNLTQWSHHLDGRALPAIDFRT